MAATPSTPTATPTPTPVASIVSKAGKGILTADQIKYIRTSNPWLDQMYTRIGITNDSKFANVCILFRHYEILTKKPSPYFTATPTEAEALFEFQNRAHIQSGTNVLYSNQRIMITEAFVVMNNEERSPVYHDDISREREWKKYIDGESCSDSGYSVLQGISKLNPMAKWNVFIPCNTITTSDDDFILAARQIKFPGNRRSPWLFNEFRYVYKGSDIQSTDDSWKQMWLSNEEKRVLSQSNVRLDQTPCQFLKTLQDICNRLENNLKNTIPLYHANSIRAFTTEGNQQGISYSLGDLGVMNCMNAKTIIGVETGNDRATSSVHALTLEHLFPLLSDERISQLEMTQLRAFPGQLIIWKNQLYPYVGIYPGIVSNTTPVVTIGNQEYRVVGMASGLSVMNDDFKIGSTVIPAFNTIPFPVDSLSNSIQFTVMKGILETLFTLSTTKSGPSISTSMLSSGLLQNPILTFPLSLTDISSASTSSAITI